MFRTACPYGKCMPLTYDFALKLPNRKPTPPVYGYIFYVNLIFYVCYDLKFLISCYDKAEIRSLFINQARFDIYKFLIKSFGLLFYNW